MKDVEPLVEELRRLPSAKLAEVAGFIHQLSLHTDDDRDRALDRAFGCLTEAEANEVEAAK